jgi:formate-dependent nitrite reductase membrane component NrfD
MVPEADFTSYYGRPVIKAPRWSWDIPAYLFLGGLSGGSALMGAGGDLSGRPALRRAGRLGGLAAITASAGLLVHDLGRPERFLNMLRVAKPTSPMSMGTWIITAYAPGIGVAAVGELLPWLPREIREHPVARLVGALARPAGLAAAAIAPALASYTAVLLADTAVPAWHEAHRELPFVFIGSSAASAAGLGLVFAPVSQAGPVRRLATFGAIMELGASRRIENQIGLAGEAYTTGTPARLLEAAGNLTAGGVLMATMLGRRSRTAAVVAGLMLMAGGAFERFGLYYAGIASANDPRYTVVPQRRRLERDGPVRAGG